MEQNAIFRLVENGKEIEEIEAKVEFDDDGSLDINFFDRNTGYSGKSSAFGAQQYWWWQNPEHQENANALMNAVDLWYDWTDHLSWSDGGEDVFLFEFTGKKTIGVDGDEYKELKRVA